MAMYVHRKLQCLVTEKNYTEFGIPNLDDPEMYRVVDIPEDVDFLENNVTFGDPTWDDENKTVYLHPVISPIGEDYKQHLLKNFKDTCFQDVVTACFEEAWKSFSFRSFDGKETYRFAADVNGLFQAARRSINSWVPCAFPVLVCDENDLSAVLDMKFIHMTGSEMGRLYKVYSAHLVQATHLGSNRYQHASLLKYDEVVRIIKQKNAENGIIPDDMADVITFSKDKGQFKRTVTKK